MRNEMLDKLSVAFLIRLSILYPTLPGVVFAIMQAQLSNVIPTDTTSPQ